MNLINLSYNGVKNTFGSFSLFTISINVKTNKEISEPKIENEHNLIVEKPVFKDHKTTLGKRHIDLIDKINDNVIVYLFIQKRKSSSDWNLVAPIIWEKSTGKISQFGFVDFALEGCGGGLNNTSLILKNLKNLRKKGFKVSVLPKVIDNELLNNFEFVDSGTKLIDLVENSTDLINYRNDAFEWIFKQYSELILKYGLE
jgi:hypothetical protein